MSNNIRSYQGISPSLAPGVYVDPTAVLYGDIHIGEDSSIWPFVSARGDVNHIRIGQRTNIQDGSVLHVTHKNPSLPDGYPLLIGDDVTVGHKVMLHGCHIGNRILIGMGAIVMDNTVVEDEVIIGAGSLVPPNKTLESGYLYVGRPAKRIRPLTEDELTFLSKSSLNYVGVKQNYLDDVNAQD